MRSTPLLFAVSMTVSAPLVMACSGGDSGGDAADLESSSSSSVASALTPSSASGCDADAIAGGGWLSTAIPPSDGAFSVTFRVTPELAATARPPVIDAVVGLSNGGARGYADLGPAVRFNTNGTIDVRNGTTYAADEAFPYTFGGGPYEIRMDVDVASHTYSVFARHLDQIGKPMETLATNYAFRTEQHAVTQLDSLDRYVDGAAGGVQTCGFSYAAAPVVITTSSSGGGAEPAVAPLLRGAMRALVNPDFYPITR